MAPKHIVIFAEKGIDRSVLMDRLTEKLTVSRYGFITRSSERNTDGYHAIYMYSASDPARERREDNHIGDCNGRDRTVNTSVFDRLGMKYLEAENDGVIVMDELGFMETGSASFCKKVMDCLDGDIPVLASAKDRPDVEFLNQVRNHPNVKAVYLTPDNVEDVYHSLLRNIEEWNGQCSKT